MSNKHDFLVFIGRFQPFHKGHYEVVQQALDQAKKVIIIIGSAEMPRNIRNPWTWIERSEMIRACFPEAGNRLITTHIVDNPYNDTEWATRIRSIVHGIASHEGNGRKSKIGLIGHEKDHTSYYLKMFPEWDNIPVEAHETYDGTRIREEYFSKEFEPFVNFDVPKPVFDYLHQFVGSETYEQIRREHKYIENYKDAWSHSPYPPVFVTVDAVVVQSGHILLIRRKADPGNGLMALPGGFIDITERVEDSMLRELREETKIKVPEPVLRGNIHAKEVFDEPMRSARGRVISHAYLIQLPDDTKLPKVKGGSDANKAMWVPIDEIQPTEMFEDHYFIIEKMVGFTE